MNDAELLHEYISEKSEAAFRELVERHVPLVYSAALRQVGEPALAQDIAQAVFIILARKARQLAPDTILPGWLFRTTRHVAARTVRANQRRRRREQEALEMRNAQPIDVWEQVAPLLDDALAQLGEVERGAVLLHYFQNKRLRDVGLALGMSEDTAQKRVSRAIRKLRKLLLKRGAQLTVVTLPGLLMTHGVQAAPSCLGATVTAAALSQVAVSTPVYALLQEAMHESLWPKLATTLSGAAALAVLVALVMHFWPSQSAQGAATFSFETRIAARSPYVAPPPSPASPAPEEAGAPPPGDETVIAEFQPPYVRPIVLPSPAVTNTLPLPTATFAGAQPLEQAQSAPVERPTAMPPPSETDGAVPAVVWRAAYLPGYPASRNVVWVGGGVSPMWNTNAAPMVPMQRPAMVTRGTAVAKAPPAPKRR